jgi:hypothetical protein
MSAFAAVKNGRSYVHPKAPAGKGVNPVRFNRIWDAKSSAHLPYSPLTCLHHGGGR